MSIRKMVAATLAVALIVMMAGCGNGGGKSATPADTADKMLAAMKPQSELNEAAESVVDNYYSIDSAVITGQKVYMNTMWEAEELAVFSYAEGKEAEAKKMVEQRLQDLKDSFDGYKEEDLASINDNAKILVGGGNVCLLVGTADNVAAAEKIFGELNN